MIDMFIEWVWTTIFAVTLSASIIGILTIAGVL